MTPVEKVAAWNERLEKTEFLVELAGDFYRLRLRGVNVGEMNAENIERTVRIQTNAN